MNFNEKYYSANSQDGDRPALWMYEGFWQRYLSKGPVLEFGCGVGYFARRLSADAFRATRTLVQFLLARPLLREGDGENVVFILEKRS